MKRLDINRVPIKKARDIAREFGYDQVIILARLIGEDPEPYGCWVTTYGRNEEHCDAAELIGQDWIGGLIEGKYKLIEADKLAKLYEDAGRK